MDTEVPTERGDIPGATQRAVPIPCRGKEFLLAQEDSEKIVFSIIDDIIEETASQHVENYYASLLPEYEASRAIQTLDSLLDMCFLEKDGGEPDFLTDTSWIPGEEPTTCPIDSWACGAVPVRVETKDVSYRPISSPSEMGNTRASKTSHKGVNKTSGGSKRQSGISSNAGTGGNKRGDDKNEKKGAKIVVRMAQPLNASGQASASTSQNEAIRLAVEAERKLREEAKEKIAMNARLELENVNRLKKELRGKQYTYTSNGVLMLKPVNADRLPETTIVPSIITRKPVEDDQEATDGKGAKGKGNKTADKNKKKTGVTTPAGSSTGPQQGTGSVGDKGKKAASQAPPIPTSLMGLYPDKRDSTTYKPAESSQQPILEAVQLKSGVTIRVGNQVKQGAPQAASAGKRKLEMPALNQGNVMSAPVAQASQQQAAQAQAAAQAAQAAIVNSQQQQKEQEKAAAQAAAAAAAAQAAAQAKAKEVALAAIREGRQAAAVTAANQSDGSGQQVQKNQLIIIQNQNAQGGAGSQEAQNAAIAQARKQGISANNPELARLLAIQEEQRPHFTLSSMTPAVPVAEQQEIQIHPSHAFNAALVKQQNWGKMSDIRELNPGQLPQRRTTPEIKMHRERDIPAQHANYSFVSSSAVPEPLYTQKPPGAAFIVGQNQVGVSERYKYTNKQSALAAVESVAAVTGRMGSAGKIVDDKGNVLIENPDPGGLVDEAFVHSFNLSTKRVMAPMTATAGGIGGIGIPGKPLQSNQQQAVQQTHYTNMPAQKQYYSPSNAAQKRPLGEAISSIRELAMSTRLADPNNQVGLAESFVSVANVNARKPTVVASNISQMRVNDIPQAHIFNVPQKYS